MQHKALEGGGAASISRHRSQGKMTARERISHLIDKGKPCIEIGTFAGYTDIFIYPGFKFLIADMLLTNFHLPKSTLLMLICAFSGIKKIKNAYNHAIQQKYRFFSYGDCCLLKKQ